jgi:hypothetical protein
MTWLTGLIPFTKQVVMFEDDIKSWKDKEIIFSYQGYGGWQASKLNKDTLEFEYGISKEDWEMHKEYKAKVIQVNDSIMTIQLEEDGYLFNMFASDFRDSKLKWQFDIGEL